ncbi:hypothetical protein G210_2031 [Candida maltosa Xu316]|uniref:Uncharacterized protein n=1 Tax=Candida maltosa (strain Xu316) TaxID=1245528 RepID=M3JYS3_CANMX|nr:hypothetical protein G210_2031 [Candida maltosa Xu316]
MSYFVVPAISYQTKQKLEQQQKEKEKHRKKKKHSSGSKRSSTGSKSSQDDDDNKSIMTNTSSMTKLTTHPSNSRSSSSSNQNGLKTITQLREPSIQESTTELNKPTMTSKPDFPEFTKKTMDSFNLVAHQLSQKPTFDESAQNLPTEQTITNDANIEINKEASIIASKYGEALRSNTAKSPSTQGGNRFSKSPPPGRPRSGSMISNGSVPSIHSPHYYPQNQVFHRNMSVSSNLSSNSQASSPWSQKDGAGNPKFRKLSFLGSSSLGKRKGSVTSSPGAAGSPGSFVSKVEDSYFPEYTTKATPPPLPTNSFQPFRAIIDLSVYNTKQSMERNFFAPQYQIFRYNSFLDLLSEYHSGDAINISNIRYHLLLKFISKQKNARDYTRKGLPSNSSSSYSLTMADSVLAYHLYGPTRAVLRQIIKNTANNQELYNHEELVQCNFINFVRYIISIPKDLDTKDFSDIEKKIYDIKHVFESVADDIFTLKKDRFSDSMLSEDNSQLRYKLLIETITKVCYEYLLLEKYRFDIISKYHNNNLIDDDILRQFFQKYENNLKTKNRENVKVLIYNTTNSVQYSNYFALTTPFIRIFESHIYTEDSNLIKDKDAYRDAELKTPKVDFTPSDQELFETFTKKIPFTSYAEFKSLTMDKLVKLHKSIDNQSPKYARINRHEMPDPASNYSFKPMNFEYYGASLTTIPNNTFELIHSPDLAFQLTKANYKTVLEEFHRILKPGGFLNVDTVQFGAQTAKDFLNKYKDGKFPSAGDTEDFGVYSYFNSMPDFLEVVLSELSRIFGKNQVKFGISILSSKSDVTAFIIKFAGMRLFEVLGKFDAYCDSFQENGERFDTINDESIHFGIQIRATKQ